MRNCEPPTKPKRQGTPKPDALKDWHAEVQRAKFAYVRDTPFPKQDKALANGEEHRLLSCLYSREMSKHSNSAKSERKAKETKGDAKGGDPTEDTGGDEGGGND